VGGSDKEPCDAGYYCEEESDKKNPSSSADSGGICPVDHYCEEGQGTPWACNDGFKQDKTGQSYCDACTDGYYCINGGEEMPCPAYHYCDGNTTYPYGKLCDNGFYGLAGET
jgi:hypothetical protein